MALFGRPSAKDQAREEAWRLWFQRQNPLALASLVFSIFSLTHLGTLIIDELAGVVLGVTALRQLRRVADGVGGTGQDDPPWSTKPEGRPLAWAGIVLGLLSLGLACVVYFWPGR
jgi:hypothetical protein